jgi:hypothetical protein
VLTEPDGLVQQQANKGADAEEYGMYIYIHGTCASLV